MITSNKTRYKTGEKSPSNSTYRFDGYTMGLWSPEPTQEEKVIQLTTGETFPPIRSANKACWWIKWS